MDHDRYPSAGGIWWNTDHPYKSGEALASATLLATLLYQQTHAHFALAQALRFLSWANTTGFSLAWLAVARPPV